jgi:hypothetical protein
MDVGLGHNIQDGPPAAASDFRPTLTKHEQLVFIRHYNDALKKYRAGSGSRINLRQAAAELFNASGVSSRKLVAHRAAGEVAAAADGDFKKALAAGPIDESSPLSAAVSGHLQKFGEKNNSRASKLDGYEDNFKPRAPFPLAPGPGDAFANGMIEMQEPGTYPGKASELFPGSPAKRRKEVAQQAVDTPLPEHTADEDDFLASDNQPGSGSEPSTTVTGNQIHFGSSVDEETKRVLQDGDSKTMDYYRNDMLERDKQMGTQSSYADMLIQGPEQNTNFRKEKSAFFPHEERSSDGKEAVYLHNRMKFSKDKTLWDRARTEANGETPTDALYSNPAAETAAPTKPVDIKELAQERLDNGMQDGGSGGEDEGGGNGEQGPAGAPGAPGQDGVAGGNGGSINAQSSGQQMMDINADAANHAIQAGAQTIALGANRASAYMNASQGTMPGLRIAGTVAEDILAIGGSILLAAVTGGASAEVEGAALVADGVADAEVAGEGAEAAAEAAEPADAADGRMQPGKGDVASQNAVRNMNFAQKMQQGAVNITRGANAQQALMTASVLYGADHAVGSAGEQGVQLHETNSMKKQEAIDAGAKDEDGGVYDGKNDLNDGKEDIDGMTSEMMSGADKVANAVLDPNSGQSNTFDTLRMAYGEAEPSDVLPDKRTQMASDIRFDMFDYVSPGFGNGVANKLFQLEESNTNRIRFGGQLMSQSYDGPINGVAVPPWQLQRAIPASYLSMQGKYDMLEKRAASSVRQSALATSESTDVLGDDIGYKYERSSKDLPRNNLSPFEPMIRNDMQWTNVKMPTGVALNKKRFRLETDAMRYPRHLAPSLRMMGGPTMSRTRALEVILP